MPVKCPRPSIHPGADRELAITFAPEELLRLGSAAKISSKFEAEGAILEAIENRGLCRW